MTLRRTAVTMLLALVAMPAPAAAQRNGSTTATPPPAVTAARLETAIAVDGRLDEEAWQKAPAATGLRQYQPNEGAPESLTTEVRFLFDDRALYVGARMVQPEGVDRPAGPQGPAPRRQRQQRLLQLPDHRQARRPAGSLPQPPGRRVVRGESQRVEGRTVQRRSVVGSGLGSGHARRFGGVDGGDAHPLQPAPVLDRAPPDLGAPDLAVCRQPERAGHVVVPAAGRRQRARLLRSARRAGHPPAAQAARTAPLRRRRGPVRRGGRGEPVRRRDAKATTASAGTSSTSSRRT